MAEFSDTTEELVRFHKTKTAEAHDPTTFHLHAELADLYSRIHDLEKADGLMFRVFVDFRDRLYNTPIGWLVLRMMGKD